MIEEIYKYMESQVPREGCGLVVNNNFLPCTNVSEKEDEFIISSKEYLQAILKYGKIDAIVHSHVDQTPLKFSDQDIRASEYLNIPYWVVGIPQREIIVHG